MKWSLLFLLLAGCSSTPYEALVGEYESGTETTYLRISRAESATAPDPLADLTAETAAAQVRWEQALAVAPTTGLAESATPPPVESLATSLELPGLVALVLARNPGIDAAAQAVKATREKYPQAVALDSVLQQYNAFTKQLDTRIGPTSHKGMNAMSLPFPDAMALKGKLVSEEIDIAASRLEIAKRDAITAMHEAYFDLLFVDQGIAINREQQALLEQMIAVAQTKVRTDRSKYQGLIMAQVELSKLANAIITLEEQRETVIARINTMLNLAPDGALAAPSPAPVTAETQSLDSWYEKALAGRQELLTQRLRIVRTKTMIELASRIANPDVSLGTSYFEDRMRLSSGTGEAQPAFTPQRELNHRQTPQFGERNAYIREVTVRVTGMESMLTGMEDRTRLAVKKAHFALERAERSIGLYRDSLLPQAQQSLEAAAAGYRAGSVDFLTFLDTERTLLRFRLEEKRAARDQGVALAHLNQLSGKIR